MQRCWVPLISALILAVFAGVTWWIVRAATPERTAAVNGTESAADALIPSTILGRPEPDLADQYRCVDPRVDGWDTEAFSSAAEAQLGRIGKLLTRPDAPSPEEFDPLATSDFAAHSLRPPLQPAFTEGALGVYRPSAGGTATGAVLAFRPALESLLAPHGRSAEARVKFKIVGVEPSEAGVQTRVLFEMLRRFADRAVQQSATWSCTWAPQEDGTHRLAALRVEDYEESVNESRDLWFADRTAGVLGRNDSYREQLVHGIDYWQARIDNVLGLHYTGHHGVAIGDVNGDGLDDIYVCQPGGVPNRLFVQNKDGTATDVSARAGVDWLDMSHAALFVDFDNDGDQDLVVGVGDYLMFMSNDGTGHFRKERRIPTGFSTPMSLAAADYDLDGLVDLYVCIYDRPVERSAVIRDAAGDDRGAERFVSTPAMYHDANNGGDDILFKNMGHWTFSMQTRAAGLDETNHRFSLAACWEDYDNDGDPDLFVANDFGRSNLYRNDGGHFTDVAAAAGVDEVGASMSASWDDFNRDGLMDLYVGKMFSSAGSRITSQRQFKPGVDDHLREQFRQHARGNSLYENSGDGTFRDKGLDAAVAMGRWAWSSNFADLNNDGWSDLFVANGYVTQHDGGDL